MVNNDLTSRHYNSVNSGADGVGVLGKTRPIGISFGNTK
jgi:hypothetical protein